MEVSETNAIRAEVCSQLNGKLIDEDATGWVGRSIFETGTFGILFEGLGLGDDRKMAVRLSHDKIVFNNLDPSEIEPVSKFLIIPRLLDTVPSTDMHMTTNHLRLLNDGMGLKGHIYMSLEGGSIPFSTHIAAYLKGVDDYVFCTSVMEPLFDAMMWLRGKGYVLRGVLTGTDEPSSDVVRYDFNAKKMKLCCDSRWVEQAQSADGVVGAGTRSEFLGRDPGVPIFSAAGSVDFPATFTPGPFFLGDDIDNDVEEEGTDDSWRRRKVMAPTPAVVGYLTGSKYLAVLMWIKVFGGSPIPGLMTAERLSDPTCGVLFGQAYIAAFKRDKKSNKGNFALSAGVHVDQDRSEGWEAGGARIENKGHASKSNVHLGTSYSWLLAMMSSAWDEKSALFGARLNDGCYIGRRESAATVVGYAQPYVPGLWFRRGFKVPSNPHVLTVLQFSDGLWILGLMDKEAVPEWLLPPICRTHYVPYAELVKIHAIVGYDSRHGYLVEWADGGEPTFQPEGNLPAELVHQYNNPQTMPTGKGKLNDSKGKVAQGSKYRKAKDGEWQADEPNKPAKERSRPELPPTTTKRVPPAEEVPTGRPSDPDVLFEIEKIVEKKIKEDGNPEYRIRWKGGSTGGEGDTWEEPHGLPSGLVEAYEHEGAKAVSQSEAMDLAPGEYSGEPEMFEPGDEGAVSNDDRPEDDREDGSDGLFGQSGSPTPRPTGEPTTTTLFVGQDATRFHSSLAGPDPKRHKPWPW